MNYLSPFHILPKAFSEGRQIDKNTLKQARKVLMAEFELQGGTTIFINEKEYDKDGILKFFDELEKDSNLEFHSTIFQHKPLLHFLEKGDKSNYKAVAIFLSSKVENNELAFIKFIEPYFIFHYNQLLYNALRNNNQDDLFQFVDRKFPLPTESEAAAYQSSYRWYHQKLRDVEKIERALIDKEFVPGSQIYELIEPSFILNFNRMTNYFFDIRDKYAFKLYEIIVLLNNDFKRTELARAILDEGIKLNVEHRTHQYYVEADKVVQPKEPEKKRYNWLFFYIIAQVLLIIIKFSTCNTPSRTNYDFKFDTYKPEFNYTFEDSTLIKSMQQNRNDLIDLDSLIKELEKEYIEIQPE